MFTKRWKISAENRKLKRFEKMTQIKLLEINNTVIIMKKLSGYG